MRELKRCPYCDGSGMVFDDELMAGRWIPVSEGVPKSLGTYYVTCKDGTLIRTTFCKWQNKFKRWDMSGRRANWKVIAWMPLPEPYKESDGER